MIWLPILPDGCCRPRFSRAEGERHQKPKPFGNLSADGKTGGQCHEEPHKDNGINAFRLMQPDGFERLTIEIQEKRKTEKAGAQQNRQEQVMCSALLVSCPFAEFELMPTVT